MLVSVIRMSEKRGSSYNEDFVNLFGADTPLRRDGSEVTGGDEQGTVSQSPSVQPASLLVEGASMAQGVVVNSDDTPNILLEQLAYVDNFMPSLEQDYATLDSWIMAENQDSAGGLMGDRSLALDERLATELSAFADDSFIFPDEDKRHAGRGDDDGAGDGDDDNDGNNNGSESRDNGHGNSHFLTQRRNTFLTSQYDHSKSRFSSRRKRGKEQNSGRESRVTSPVQDHGGFVNVDITPNGSSSFYAPAVPSPLTNLVASQPYSVSNSPENVGTRAASSVRDEPLPAATGSGPRIHLPDYSKLPTSTLVALLPRVVVPPGAYQALINQGLGADQIDAIAVIIAHHEKEKQRQKSKEEVERQNGTSNGNNIERSASFLIDILSNITQSGEPSKLQADSVNGTEKSPVETPSSTSLNEVAEIGESRKRSIDESAVKLENGSDDAGPLKKWKSAKAVPTSKAEQKLSLRRKMKESKLETSVHELSELATSLQQKIHTLETENEVLKKLVISSGELEGIERAEKIKTELLKQINDPQEKGDESDVETTTSQKDT